VTGDLSPLKYSLKAAESVPNSPAPKFEDDADQSPAWLSQHVFTPMLNGTGLVGIANNFKDKPVRLEAPKPTNNFEWAVENLSSVAGAVVPYFIVGELMHGAGRGLARDLEITGKLGKVMASEGVAQVAGAGFYDAMKRPDAEKGETRTGQGAGTVTGFTMYSIGNSLLAPVSKLAPNPVLRIALNASSKLLVGGLGGEASYEVSNRVSNALGMHNELTMEGRVSAITQGAFLNTAIPSLHYGYGWIRQNVGATVPVGDHFRNVTDQQARALIKKEFLTDVQIVPDSVGQSSVDIGANKLLLRRGDDTPAQLQELQHISLAREFEPQYQKIAELAKDDPATAQDQFMALRAQIEIQARQFETALRARMNNMNSSPEAAHAPSASDIANERAGNGRTYKSNWAAEWASLLVNPQFRPQFEFHGENQPPPPAELPVTTAPVRASEKQPAPAPAVPEQPLTASEKVGSPEAVLSLALEQAPTVAVVKAPEQMVAKETPAVASASDQVAAKETPAVPSASDQVAAKETPAVVSASDQVAAKETPAVASASDQVAAKETPAVASASNQVAAKETPAVAPSPDTVATKATTDQGNTKPLEDLKAPEIRKWTAEELARGDLGPFGATVTDKGVNFALPSDSATKIELLLWDKSTDKVPSQVLPMFRTERLPLLHEGGVFHRFVEGAKEGTLYTYRVYGEWNPTAGSRINHNSEIADPFAKAVVGDVDTGKALAYDTSNISDPDRHLRPNPNSNVGEMSKGIAVKNDFPWGNDKPLNIPIADTIMYEVHLRGFSARQKELGQMAGKFSGLKANIPRLKELGVTAVELMPIFKFNKGDWPHTDPVTGKPLFDSWGYNPLFLFAPETRFAADGPLGEQVNEFKDMVREFHKNGIEVILDVVYNHSGEGNQYGPTINLKGLDNRAYYLHNPDALQNYIDNTGVGNTVSANHPLTQELILNSLRYWAQEMHVDGFRFDLATIFKYRENGQEQDHTPIMRAIEKDPILSQRKIVAEPWGPKQYYVGRFSPVLWGEWNDHFRDTVRDFWIGTYNRAGAMGDVIVGSPGTYKPSRGTYPVNAITFHDGFTLEDWLSFNQKHNEMNGEGNRDGSDNNRSWNHGFEGSLKVNLTGNLRDALAPLAPIMEIDRASVWWAPKEGGELNKVVSYDRVRMPETQTKPASPAPAPAPEQVPATAAPVSKPEQAPGTAAPESKSDQLPISETTAKATEPLVPPAKLTEIKEPKNEGNAFVVPMRKDPNGIIEGYLLVEHNKPLPADATDTILGVAKEGSFTLSKANAIKNVGNRDEIQALRDKQAKNMMTTVMVSRGMPQILYGDEVGRSADGNNNAWCVERLNELDPELATMNADRLRFTSEIIRLRQEHRIGRAEDGDFKWHGVEPDKPDWGGGARTIAREINATAKGGSRLYHAFNAHTDPVQFKLPAGKWRRLVDTSLTNGEDIVRPDDSVPFQEGLSYVVQPRSAVIFQADDKPLNVVPPQWKQLELDFDEKPDQKKVEGTK